MSQEEKYDDNYRVRRWAFTINNPTEEDRDQVTAMRGLSYLIYGNEVGEQGTPHLQGYAVFKNAKRFGSLRREVPRAYWKKAYKGHLANIRYCSKDGDIFEMGERPVDEKNDKEKIDMSELKRDPKNAYQKIVGKRMYNGYQLEQEMLKSVLEKKLEKPDIWYIYGSSGTGKTYFAIKKACEIYGIENVAQLRFKNNFAISNNPQAKALILPEFRPSNLDASSFLEFTDCYGMILNVKGSQIYIRPKAIFICSIKSPYEIYKEEINIQFRRRITHLINKDENPYESEGSDTEVE